MVRLHEISWSEAKELFEKTDVAILPVGSLAARRRIQ